jgi:hypothetical protein
MYVNKKGMKNKIQIMPQKNIKTHTHKKIEKKRKTKKKKKNNTSKYENII